MFTVYLCFAESDLVRLSARVVGVARSTSVMRARRKGVHAIIFKKNLWSVGFRSCRCPISLKKGSLVSRINTQPIKMTLTCKGQISYLRIGSNIIEKHGNKSFGFFVIFINHF